MKRNVLAYVLTVLVFGTGILLVLRAGKTLELSIHRSSSPMGETQVSPENSTAPQTRPEHGFAGAFATFRENFHDPLSLLLVQLILIVLLARLFGALAVRFGQPAVIGEMLAGIVLGPSLVGMLFPHAFNFLFPTGSLGTLRMLSQVGVILFIFVVGMELDVKHLRQKADTAVMVSHVSIIFPYFLGVLYSLFIFRGLAAPNASFIPFALFMGIAMSITAFPVLARIIEERGLTKTFLGATAITCAAVDDVTAWSILAFVVAFAKAGGVGESVLTILLVLGFAAFILLCAKPFLNRSVSARLQTAAQPSGGTVVAVMIFVFCCALFTEIIGIHALFGAFLAGIAMPADPAFRSRLREKLENFSSSLLLPLFFAFTGLRTQIGLLNDWHGWLVCGGLVLAATLGKLGGSMVAARWTGMDWHDSFCLGALLNTRGLVELIVLNIGYDLGILTPPVFAMMVVMALVTTCMTAPLLSLAGFLRGNRAILDARSRAV